MSTYDRQLALLVFIIIVLGFGLAGQGDYADAVARENAELRAAMAACRVTESMAQRRED